MTAIWSREGEDWSLLKAIGFPDEAALHSLVEDAPQLLPLAGSPALVVLGREVRLGSGYADLIAVEPSGRVVVIEVKLAGNPEARRAVVAQILAYAAVLYGLSPEAFEQDVLSKQLAQGGFGSLADAIRGSDQVGDFDEDEFRSGVASSLESGAFRLVLVLDSAPPELVRLVGYLEDMTAGLVIDLVTVSAYEVGGRTVMVPQRVDPERIEKTVVTTGTTVARTRPANRPANYHERDQAADFAKSLDGLSEEKRATLERLIEWALSLERDGLATVYSFRSHANSTLLTRIAGQDVGPFTVWGRGYVTAFRSVLERFAPSTLADLDARLEKPVGTGSVVDPIDDEMLALMRRAFEEARES